jgi:hypothetical protein
MRLTLMGALTLTLSLSLGACGAKPQAQATPETGSAQAPAASSSGAVIELAKGGSIQLEFFPDVAPATVANF